jgi:hypothetical protein
VPHVACPLTCGTCCEDDDTYKFQLKFKNKLKPCTWFLKNDEKTEKRINNYCTDENDAGELHSWVGQTVRDACPKSCNFCQDLIPAIYAPSETSTMYRSDITSETPTNMKPSSQIPNSWQRMGGDLDGEAVYDLSGRSVSLSSDGNTVAIGATGNDRNGDCSGHTRVFRWCSTILAWHHLGVDLDGEAADDRSGHSVSLSSNGNVLAIGVITGNGSGHTRVYTLDSSTLTWLQMGDDINGEAAYDYSGASVSLSSNGNTLAVGARYNAGNGSRSGHVRVYKWDSLNSNWLPMGDDINGEVAGDFSGDSVSLSSDGVTVAIGARFNDGNGIVSGHVRVYSVRAA